MRCVSLFHPIKTINIMKKLFLVFFCFSPLFSVAQNTEDVRLTSELKNILDDYTYQVVLFKHGTIVPVREKQDDPSEFAKTELQKSIENEYGLKFAGLIHNLQNVKGFMVEDYQDIKNYVFREEGIAILDIAKKMRQLDADNPEIIYISKK